MAAQESRDVKGVDLGATAAIEAEALMEDAGASAGDAASLSTLLTDDEIALLGEKRKQLLEILNRMDDQLFEISQQIGFCDGILRTLEDEDLKKDFESELRRTLEDEVDKDLQSNLKAQPAKSIAGKLDMLKSEGLQLKTLIDQDIKHGISTQGALKIADEDLQRYQGFLNGLPQIKMNLNEFAKSLPTPKKEKKLSKRRLGRALSKRREDIKRSMPESSTGWKILGVTSVLSFAGVMAYQDVKINPWQSAGTVKQHWPHVAMVSLALLLTVIMMLYAYYPKLFNVRTLGSGRLSKQNYTALGDEKSQKNNHKENTHLSKFFSYGAEERQGSDSGSEEDVGDQETNGLTTAK